MGPRDKYVLLMKWYIYIYIYIGLVTSLHLSSDHVIGDVNRYQVSSFVEVNVNNSACCST